MTCLLITHWPECPHMAILSYRGGKVIQSLFRAAKSLDENWDFASKEERRMDFVSQLAAAV